MTTISVGNDGPSTAMMPMASRMNGKASWASASVMMALSSPAAAVAGQDAERGARRGRPPPPRRSRPAATRAPPRSCARARRGRGDRCRAGGPGRRRPPASAPPGGARSDCRVGILRRQPRRGERRRRPAPARSRRRPGPVAASAGRRRRRAAGHDGRGRLSGDGCGDRGSHRPPSTRKLTTMNSSAERNTVHCTTG